MVKATKTLNKTFKNPFIESLLVSAMVMERHLDTYLKEHELYGISQLKMLVAIDRAGVCQKAMLKANQKSTSKFALPPTDCLKIHMCTQSMIAHALGVSEAAISRQVLGLENDNLLVRSHDPTEKRRVILSLTEKGRKVVIKSLNIMDKELSRLMKPLSESTEKQLAINLKKVLEALSTNTHHYEITAINN